MLQRPKAQSGFDSRPVADTATGGDRRYRLHVDRAPSPWRHVRGVSLRATESLRADQHRNRATGLHWNGAARPALKGQGEP